jgi:hypothetical protein
MELPNGEQAICHAVLQLLGSIHEFSKRDDRVFPAFVLLYSTVDIVAALTRPAGKKYTTGLVFRAWVDKYVLKDTNHRFTAFDIWGARCGCLHQMTTRSEVEDKRKARRFAYVNDPIVIDRLQADSDARGINTVWVCTPQFFAAIVGGVTKYLEELQHNVDLRELAIRNAKDLTLYVKTPKPK